MKHVLTEKNSKTICPLAWNHSFVNQDGTYQLCCTSEEFDNLLRDKNGKALKIEDGKNAIEVLNSETLKATRLQMLDGKWPLACRRCLISEKSGGVSRREIEFKAYSDKIESFLNSTNADGSVDKVEITSLDYRLGNLCNLQCRMCNPRSTKLWIGEWNELKPANEQFSPEVMDSYTKYNWIDSEYLVQDFEQKAQNLEHIHFAGGEPLLVPQMAKILQKCIDSGNAKNIVVTYNTNLTILPKKILELWKQFKGIKILASIDGIGDLNHYIRYPSNWENIEKNLKFIEENHKEYNIWECMLSTTVQILNIHRLDEIYNYLTQFKFIVPVPNLVMLYMPHYFQPCNLPPELKLIATKKLILIKMEKMNSIPDHYKYLVENIDSILKIMNSYDGFSNGGFEMFKKFQNQFDERKKLALLKSNPEFKKYL